MVKRFVVIGHPIAHSLSPTIHQYFAHQTNIDLSYEKIEGNEHDFERQVSDFFNQKGKGMNVTLPFKQRAFAMVHERTTRCILAGAANTLWFENQRLYADNTDGIGLIRDLSRYLDLEGKRILILGAGGAARGIIAPLQEKQPSVLTIATRTLDKSKALQEDFPHVQVASIEQLSGTFDLIINATSASLEGKTIMLPADVVAQKPFCYDLAYQQKTETPFVAYAKNLGCRAVDGMGMLVEQAAESFFIWNGVMPDTGSVLEKIR